MAASAFPVIVLSYLQKANQLHSDVFCNCQKLHIMSKDHTVKAWAYLSFQSRNYAEIISSTTNVLQFPILSFNITCIILNKIIFVQWISWVWIVVSHELPLVFFEPS
jgi:hypothetical protein